MPRVGLPLALMTSPPLHRLLPSSLAARLGEAQGWMVWCSGAGVRERARASMHAIVGGTHRAHEADRLARRHVMEKYVQKMLFWQPPRIARVDERSLANLRTAFVSGRGVVISACHLGAFFDVSSSPVALDRHSFVVGGGWFFDSPTPDYAGRRLTHWWGKTVARNNRLVPAKESFPVLQALLEEGEVAVVFFDIIGTRETMFVGKPTKLTNGTARLAIAAGALVLPARARRVGGRVSVDVEPALDPKDFTEPAQLHAAIADVHSKLILEYPETLEDPRRTGAWEDGATAEAWIAPPHLDPAQNPR
jgi:lauroyl/myristoyl acyltransferase